MARRRRDFRKSGTVRRAVGENFENNVLARRAAGENFENLVLLGAPQAIFFLNQELQDVLQAKFQNQVLLGAPQAKFSKNRYC